MGVAEGKSADVIIIGAGLAGATAAAVLARQGRDVTLVDPRPVYPACFKAEKIEPEHAELLRKFGLLDGLIPWTGHIREVLEARNGRVLRPLALEQYGIAYGDMVNGVRRSLPPTVSFRPARVERMANGPDLQRVTLSTGEELTARLVVLACGTGGHLHERLGLSRRMIRREQSAAFGFTITREDRQPFGFDALTYFPNGRATRIDYLTLFLIQDSMRANLFVFRSLGEDWVRRFVREPHAELQRSLPKLAPLIGEFRVLGKVETAKSDLYAVDNHRQPGIVLIGDAFMSVCPTTGLGLSKVLTDVDVLCSECVPAWFATPGMDVEKVAAFYDHPRKRAVDRRSLQSAEYRRRLSTDTSLRWHLHRLRLDLTRRVEALRRNHEPRSA